MGAERWNVRTPSGSKPGSTARSSRKLRTMSARVTCATTRAVRIGLPSGIRRRFGLPAREGVRRLPWYPVRPVPRYGRDGSHERTSCSSAAARSSSRISALARCPTVGVSIGEMAWSDSLSLESGPAAGVGLPPLSGRDGAIPETPCRSRNHRLVGAPKQQRPLPMSETIHGVGTALGVCRNFRNGEAG